MPMTTEEGKFMPPLSAVARQQARGERNDHVGLDDPIENRAWAVWHNIRTGAAKAKGKPSKGPREKGGDLSQVDGLEVEVNVTTKCRNLWPALAQMDRLSQNKFISEIRSFLTVSGNAVCVRFPGIGPGDHGQPLWWIRNEWNDVKGVPVFRTLELTNTEKRLTPEEAGERRPVAPVETRNGAAKKTQDDANRSVVTSNADRVLAFVKAADQPVYQAEIVRGLQINSVDVGRVLRTLVQKGKLYRRYETGNERPKEQDGRFRYLYWSTKSVPRRRTPFLTGTSAAMDMVAQLKPGDELKVSWMLPVDKDEIIEMVSAGLIEWTDESKTAVRQSPDTVAKVAAKAQAKATAAPAPAAATPTAATPPAAPEASAVTPPVSTLPPDFPAQRTVTVPAPVRETAGGGIGGGLAEQIARLVEAEVDRRVAEQASTAPQLTELEARIRQLEAGLIEARSEASEQRQLAERRARALRELTS